MRLDVALVDRGAWSNFRSKIEVGFLAKPFGEVAAFELHLRRDVGRTFGGRLDTANVLQVVVQDRLRRPCHRRPRCRATCGSTSYSTSISDCSASSARRSLPWSRRPPLQRGRGRATLSRARTLAERSSECSSGSPASPRPSRSARSAEVLGGDHGLHTRELFELSGLAIELHDPGVRVRAPQDLAVQIMPGHGSVSAP